MTGDVRGVDERGAAGAGEGLRESAVIGRALGAVAVPPHSPERAA
ncbi:hypothetical protein [Streptomyces sp. SID13726]|nr:hypothetical protein [Streptomyces sp. SID13726]